MFRASLIGLLMLAAVSSRPARADLVTNGGFETGSLTPWATNGGAVIDSTFPRSGNFDAAIGDAFDCTTAPCTDLGPGTLSQTLATVAGQSYVLRFSVFDEAADPADTFTAQLGTFSFSLTGDLASAYVDEVLTVPGGDLLGNDTLLFTAGEPNFAWNLDDVSLEATGMPEPAGLAVLGGAIIAAGMIGLRRRRIAPRASPAG